MKCFLTVTLRIFSTWGDEMASVSLLVPAVVAHDSLKQTAGISAGLGVEPFSLLVDLLFPLMV